MGIVAAFVKDLAYGCRLLTARPAFTAVAVLTLALGIGANTAIFSVVHALLLAPLPFADPERLVMLWESEDGNAGTSFIVSAPNWQDWRQSGTTLNGPGDWEFQSFNVSGGPAPEQVPGLRVSSSAFTLLGVQPQLGRTFTPEEDEPGHNVVVINDALWTLRFGRNPAVVGQTMRLNGEPYEVVGVMPASLRFVQQKQALWVPIAIQATRPRAQRAFVLRRRSHCRRHLVRSRASRDWRGWTESGREPGRRQPQSHPDHHADVGFRCRVTASNPCRAHRRSGVRAVDRVRERR